MMVFDDIKMSWKPWGLTLTYSEWDELVSWYIQENISEALDNNKEED
jgi:hypothetical protein